MKTMTLKPMFLSLALAALTTSAFAKKGGVSDGGGNAVCNSQTKVCKMIEEFRVEDLSEVKGFSKFISKMELIRNELPELAFAIEKSTSKKTWYVIPAEFDLLSYEETQLRFTTTQAAYQNDREVFISQNALEQMNETTAAIKLMHESIMTLQKAPFDVIAVRTLTGQIFSKNATAHTIQEAAIVNRLGVYFTEMQFRQQRQAMKIGYISNLQSILDEAGECGLKKPDDEAWVLRLYKGNRNKLASDRINSATGRLNFGAIALSQRWTVSPFSATPYIGMRHGANQENYTEPAAYYLNEITDSSPEFREFVGNLIVNYHKPNALEEKTMNEAAKKLGKFLEEDSFRIREQLARDPALIDLIAMQIKISEKGDSVLELNMYGEKDQYVPRLTPIFSQIRARLSSVPNKPMTQPIQTLARLCSNVDSLKATVANMKSALEK